MDINNLPEGYLKHALNVYTSQGNSVSGKSVKEGTLYFALNVTGKAGTLRLLSTYGLTTAEVGVTNISNKNKLDPNKDVVVTHIAVLGDTTSADVKAATWKAELPALFKNAELTIDQQGELYKDAISSLHNAYAATRVQDDYTPVPSCPIIRGGIAFDFVIDTPNSAAVATDLNIIVKMKVVELIS